MQLLIRTNPVPKPAYVTKNHHIAILAVNAVRGFNFSMQDFSCAEGDKSPYKLVIYFCSLLIIICTCFL